MEREIESERLSGEPFVLAVGVSKALMIQTIAIQLNYSHFTAFTSEE